MARDGLAAVNPTNLASVDSEAARADNIIVWIALGLVFLWLLSFAAETVMAKLKPVLIFVIAAAMIGVVVARMLGGL